MADATCHKCHRPIGDPKQFHGFGPRCWRAIQAEAATAAHVPVEAVNRRWDAAMPGQQLLTLEEAS